MTSISPDTTGSPGGSFNFPYDESDNDDERKFYQHVRGGASPDKREELDGLPDSPLHPRPTHPSNSEREAVRRKVIDIIDDKRSRYLVSEAIADYILTLQAEARRKAASDIFDLAHEYAQNDTTMKGAEELRAYHYFNAIHKIGEFDGR